MNRLPEGKWVSPPSDRLSALAPPRQSLAAKIVLSIVRKRAARDSDLNVFMMLSRLGSIFPRYALFMSQILLKGRITRVDKEVAILRTAWRTGCIYEWGHHSKMGGECGLSTAQMDSIASDDSSLLERRHCVLIRAADEIIDQKMLRGETWQLLSEFYCEDQLVEFCMLIGHYVMVAATINSTGVAIESGYLESYGT